jgi:hypothetical protein
MINWPNLILIAGTGRKLGKTTLACNLISQISAKGSRVAAIKLTPHFHQSCPGCQMLFEADELLILKEQSKTTGKDSARMVEAGADPVFFVQANDRVLLQAIEFLLHSIPDDMPVICESAGLRRLVKPGYFILIKGDEDKPKNLDFIPLADRVIKPFEFENLQPELINNRWKVIATPAVKTMQV